MNSGASEPAHEPALIGIDWGTSSLRAYLLGRRGDVLDRIVSSEGILQVGRDGFEAVFDALVRRGLSAFSRTTHAWRESLATLADRRPG